MQSMKLVIAWGSCPTKPLWHSRINPGLKKKLLFLYLFFSLFFITQKIEASFFDPSPFTQDYGDGVLHAYATQWNPAGTHLAVGGINYPTDVSIFTWDNKSLKLQDALSFGSGAFAVSWSPNGQYLAVGGTYGNNSLIVYKWDGMSLTLTTSKYHGSQVNAVAWAPNGNTLAVGGVWGNNPLVLYSWDGSSSLTLTTSQHHGTQINALAWHPSGNKLAVGGIYGTQDVILYGWNGSTLTSLQTLDFGTSANALTWTHTGAFLAVGGNNGASSVILYRLDGSTLTPAPGTSPIAFGTQANTLAWSLDDALAIGGINPGSDLLVYYLDPIYNGFWPIASSQTSYGNGVYSISLTPYSDYLAVAGDNGSSDLTIYKNHNYLNGTKNNITLTDQYVFSGDSVGTVIGSVNFQNGCNMSGSIVKIALTEPFSGELAGINNQLVLENDLYLNSNVTLAPPEVDIYGKGHTIYLGGDLIIPDGIYFYINNEAVIDGNGHTLTLGRLSSFALNSTLTLRNLTLKNTLNLQQEDCVPFSSVSGGKVCLDNVKLALTDDFYFYNLQLFIHNDVVFTGTSKFIYKSPYQCYITKNATLYFDLGTTFSFAPLSTNKDLLCMEDASSTLYLNGATLAITHTGLRLTRGQLLLENKVTLTSQRYEGNHTQASSNRFILGNSALGANYDLNVKLLNGTVVNTNGLIKYNNVN